MIYSRNDPIFFKHIIKCSVKSLPGLINFKALLDILFVQISSNTGKIIAKI